MSVSAGYWRPVDADLVGGCVCGFQHFFLFTGLAVFIYGRYNASSGDIMSSLRAVSSNVAFLAGCAEDAHLGQGGKEGYVFDIESKSFHWLNETLKPALLQELAVKKDIKVKKRKGRLEYRIQVWDRDLVTLLSRIKADCSVVAKWGMDQQREWVQGFTDAEGSVTRNSEDQPQVSIYNKHLRKLQLIQRILQQVGVHSGIYSPTNRTVHQLFISGRKNLRYYLENGPGTSHPEKYQKLLSQDGKIQTHGFLLPKL